MKFCESKAMIWFDLGIILFWIMHFLGLNYPPSLNYEDGSKVIPLESTELRHLSVRPKGLYWDGDMNIGFWTCPLPIRVASSTHQNIIIHAFISK